jgi:hypothetical protein
VVVYIIMYIVFGIVFCFIVDRRKEKVGGWERQFCQETKTASLWHWRLFLR